MSQGLFTAASGITACQAQLDVISDNIANLNTVAFKSSQVNFATVFSRELSSGSAPTGNLGGVNPTELGLGVTIGEIGRNFDNGSIQTTGRTTDLNIQGEGFFTVQDVNGEIKLTRAGNFSFDADGFLVNPDGLKVMGNSLATSDIGSTTAVQIPTALNFVTPDAVGTDTITDLAQSSGSVITTGQFTINVDGTDVPVTINDGDTLADVVASMNTAISGAGFSSTVSVTGNQIEIDTSVSGETITFNGAPDDTSNFLSAVGFSTGGSGYTSGELKDQSEITIDTADGSADTYTVISYSIGNDGSIEATYSNGAKLTVEETNSLGDKALKYTTQGGREISISSITNGAGIDPAQLQIQLASVVNPMGLNAESGNLFSLNAIAGDVSYALAGSGGLGLIKSGSLEASNVNLSQEFANMILAQRGLEANSRTFSVQDKIMQQIVNLGR